jgi:hypothetical protein
MSADALGVRALVTSVNGRRAAQRPGCRVFCLQAGNSGTACGAQNNGCGQEHFPRVCRSYCQAATVEGGPRLPDAATIFDSTLEARNGSVSASIQCLLQPRCDGALVLFNDDPVAQFRDLGGTDLSVAPGSKQTIEVPLTQEGRQAVGRQRNIPARVGVFQKKCDAQTGGCDTVAQSVRSVTVNNSAASAPARRRRTGSTFLSRQVSRNPGRSQQQPAARRQSTPTAASRPNDRTAPPPRAGATATPGASGQDGAPAPS